MTRRVDPPQNPTGLFYAREFRGLSQDDLAEASGVSKGQISKLERGEGDGARKLTREWAERFEPHLGISAERILFWDRMGPPEDADHIDSSDVAAALPAPEGPRMVKLKGYVGAGSEAHFYRIADEDFEEVPAPPNATDKTVAVEIRGKSWGPLMDSFMVYYDDIQSPIDPSMFGRPCILGLADDRILLKVPFQQPNGLFRLVSNSDEPPIEDAIIEWAALVKSFMPKS